MLCTDVQLQVSEMHMQRDTQNNNTGDLEAHDHWQVQYSASSHSYI
jgi:hypothetical protein